jgi:hypothetical protein
MRAGAATSDITPVDSQFLFGYPHVARYTTGVHDPLLSSALYLEVEDQELLFVANDVIFVSKATTERVRRRIEAAAGVPAGHIMVTATHTHSGPVTVDYVSNEGDPVVPRADPAYLELLEDGIVSAALAARASARPAEAGLAVADGTGVGTNRRDPDGPRDSEVPVLMVRAAGGGEPLACMLVCCMHPTVLHEDSTLVSGDFPAMARHYLQREVLGPDCPIVYHTGPAGNQSPRHVTRANTFAEARRLGETLGRAVARVMPEIAYASSARLQSARAFVDLPRREFPSAAEAQRRQRRARERLERLRQCGASRQEVRTAEVDWFGAEETLTLARAAQEGRIEAFYRECLPAEVQVLKVGPWAYVALPGELFVEYGLAIKRCAPNAFVISLANGELQGYIVTSEAAREGGYEASNALFGPEGGQQLVGAACQLLAGSQNQA